MMHMLIENENLLVLTNSTLQPEYLAEHFNVMSINRQTRKIEKYHSIGVPFRIWNLPVSTSWPLLSIVDTKLFKPLFSPDRIFVHRLQEIKYPNLACLRCLL